MFMFCDVNMSVWMNLVDVFRFHKFLLWLGIPLHRVADTKPNEFCRIVSEFSLEYRTTRERVLQQLEKKANHRERNKTRGKMITEVLFFTSRLNNCLNHISV